MIKVQLVFQDWQDSDGDSVYNTEDGVDLSMGDLHSGTVFEAAIKLDDDDLCRLSEAFEKGYRPVFYLHVQKKENSTTREGEE